MKYTDSIRYLETFEAVARIMADALRAKGIEVTNREVRKGTRAMISKRFLDRN